MKFNEMGLCENVMKGLQLQGIENATEIQSKAIPLIKSGVDMVGLSQTGSGKTYAFGIPVIESIDDENPAVQALVICPTRELVTQVVDDLKKLVGMIPTMRITPIYGGAHMDRQMSALKRGSKIVVGTPGRLMDHLRRRTLKLNELRTVVLDEADEMLNMGFKEDIETILKEANIDRQTVMFSATMPSEIQRITKQFMKNPVTIKTANQDQGHASIKQYFVNCKRTEKVEVLQKIYEKTNPFNSIIFCNTKSMTEDLADQLKKLGMHASCLHGDMKQRDRSRTMDNFKKNGGVLVATDVAARGIDVKNLDIVVNYDFPNNDEYYTHRIGRTGRGGKEGSAFTIINTIQQAKDLWALVQKLGATATEYKELSTTSYLDDNPVRSGGRGRVAPAGGKGGSRNRSYTDRNRDGGRFAGQRDAGPNNGDRVRRGNRQGKSYADRSQDRFGGQSSRRSGGKGLFPKRDDRNAGGLDISEYGSDNSFSRNSSDNRTMAQKRGYKSSSDFGMSDRPARGQREGKSFGERLGGSSFNKFDKPRSQGLGDFNRSEERVRGSRDGGNRGQGRTGGRPSGKGGNGGKRSGGGDSRAGRGGSNKAGRKGR